MFFAPCNIKTERCSPDPGEPCAPGDNPWAVEKERGIKREPSSEEETIVGDAPQWPLQRSFDNPSRPDAAQKEPSAGELLVAPNGMQSNSDQSLSAISVVVPADGVSGPSFLKCLDSSGKVVLFPTTPLPNDRNILMARMAPWEEKNGTDVPASCVAGQRLPAALLSSTSVATTVGQTVVPEAAFSIARAPPPGPSMSITGEVSPQAYTVVALRELDGSRHRMLLVPSNLLKLKAPSHLGSREILNGAPQKASEEPPRKPLQELLQEEMKTREEEFVLRHRRRGVTPLVPDLLQARKGDSTIPVRSISTGEQLPDPQWRFRTLLGENGLAPSALSHAADFSSKRGISSKTFSSSRRHLAIKRHKCKYCLATFPTRDRLKSHVGIHSGDAPYECRFCPRCFGSKDDFVRHVQSHVGELPFKCSTCVKSFHNKVQLVVHRLSHIPRRPHKCRQCSCSFYLKSSLDAHLKCHVPYKCRYCPMFFASKRSLARHAHSHMDKLPFMCSTCATTFRTKAQLVVHGLAHFPNRPHECPRCSCSFYLRSSLDAHLKYHAPCERCYCSLFFASKNASAGRGIRSRGSELPFSCSRCHASFRTKAQALVHELTHTPERPHKCLQCSAAFYLRSSLDAHLEIHMAGSKPGSVDGPHRCLQCPRTFSDVWRLRMHTRMHTRGKCLRCRLNAQVPAEHQYRGAGADSQRRQAAESLGVPADLYDQAAAGSAFEGPSD